MKQLVVLAGFLLWVNGASAQTKPLRSGEILTQAQALAEKEEHKKAIELLQSVHLADTNYFKVQAYLSEVAYDAKEYNAALKAATIVQSENPHYSGKIYASLANAQEAIGDTLKAKATLAEGIKRYPYYFPLYYLTGLIDYSQKNFDAAEVNFQKTLQLNSFHSYSHIFLGLISARQGNYAHAMMSFSAALLIKSDANDILVYLENLSNDALDKKEAITQKSKVSKNDLTELDQLLKSKIALDSKFKTPVKINAALVKQQKLFLDQFNYNPASEDFWVKFYGPFFQKVKEQNLFKPFVFSLLSSSKIKEVTAWNAKSSKEKIAFLKVGNEAFIANRKTQLRTLNGKTEMMNARYYDNNHLASLGMFPDNEPSKRSGYWIFFGDNCNLEAEGNYDANYKRTGEWKFYDLYGNLTSKEIYADGVLNGLSYGYDTEGNLRSMANYKNDLRDGYAENYFPCGNVNRSFTFSQGKKHGVEKVFNTAGNLIQTGTFTNGKADGGFKYFYEDGGLKTEITFKDDLENGLLKQYNETGKLIVTGTYKNGNRIGSWTFYHNNGRLKEKMTFNEAGKPEGVAKEYSQDGKLVTENKYVEGELSEETNFDVIDEKLWSHFKYTKGKVTTYTYYDKAGKALFTYNFKKSAVPVKGFSPEGLIMFTGTYVEGKMDGGFEFYNRNGVKVSSVSYKKGELDGPAKTYYSNGQVRREYTNVNGLKEGFYKEYYANGKVLQEGWMEKGNQEFAWNQYYVNGQLEDEMFYLNDQSTGLTKSYTVSGEKASQIKYDFDFIMEAQYFKNDGAEAMRAKPNGKNFDLTVTFANGAPKFTLPLACNKYNGIITWYYLNGKKSSEISMIDGKRSGKSLSYHENGALASEGTYRNGKRTGHWKFYDENARLEREGNYNNGQDSTWITYWPNGKIRKSQEFQEDELYGVYSSYDPEGNLMMERTYVDDNIVSYRYLLPSGKFCEPIYISNGNLKLNAFYQNGKKSAEYNYEKGDLNGPQKMYYSNGNMLGLDSYRFGYSAGLDQEFYPLGKLKTESTYVDNAIQGEKKYYNEDGSLQKVETYVANEKTGPTVYYKGGRIEKKVTFWNNTQYE